MPTSFFAVMWVLAEISWTLQRIVVFWQYGCILNRKQIPPALGPLLEAINMTDAEAENLNISPSFLPMDEFDVTTSFQSIGSLRRYQMCSLYNWQQISRIICITCILWQPLCCLFISHFTHRHRSSCSSCIPHLIILWDIYTLTDCFRQLGCKKLAGSPVQL